MTFSSLPSILDSALRTQSWQVPSTGCGTEVLPKFLLESGEAEAWSNSSIIAHHCAMLTAVAPELSETSGFLCLQSKTPCRHIRPYSLHWGLCGPQHCQARDCCHAWAAPRQDTSQLCTHCALGLKHADIQVRCCSRYFAPVGSCSTAVPTCWQCEFQCDEGFLWSRDSGRRQGAEGTQPQLQLSRQLPWVDTAPSGCLSLSRFLVVEGGPEQRVSRHLQLCRLGCRVDWRVVV